jgi:N-acetylglucosamine kinase-like BadF-type ATPase
MTQPAVLVGIDAGATKSVAIARTSAGDRLGRATGPGANPKRHGLDTAADRIAALAVEATSGFGAAALCFVAGAGIDRPEHARALEAALRAPGRLPHAQVIVANDTLAVLRAATPDAVGLVVPVSTGGNVIGRAADGRVTDRGHGIFGGGYVLGALAARAVRRDDPRLSAELRAAVRAGDVGWRPDRPRRPEPEAADLGAAVARAARDGDAFATRLVDRWCGRVTAAVREECERLDLPEDVRVIRYGGLADAVPWLGERIDTAIREAAPHARLLPLTREPAEGAADLACDAWAGPPMRWDFVPRR